MQTCLKPSPRIPGAYIFISWQSCCCYHPFSVHAVCSSVVLVFLKCRTFLFNGYYFVPTLSEFLAAQFWTSNWHCFPEDCLCMYLPPLPLSTIDAVLTELPRSPWEGWNTTNLRIDGISRLVRSWILYIQTDLLCDHFDRDSASLTITVTVSGCSWLGSCTATARVVDAFLFIANSRFSVAAFQLRAY
ncbi:uncharacterized protein EV420DRAFT_1120506 [Desarmillaria tabescens]|uniref:Uncharacterized protein n=1 Tax=Armillaria tabescens TaxID=1929756 RepID=A0AA39JIQ3_ARMTA|nr:uncharacterized protein EV420DRAFT_1120506 [Desarmillaria tabescens]KAK0441193.1 hypothetical protein EV420DRAFT_1120506 [Desarmillaria tabescens]